MKKSSSFSNFPIAVWITSFGGIVTGSILLSFLFIKFSEWPWLAMFLASSAPAWIQAVGSVAAIVAALAVVHRQHTLELKRKEHDDVKIRLRRARSLRVLFYSAAGACEDVTRRIGTPHQTWKFRAEELREVRARLLAIDPLLLSEDGLLLIIEECAMRLRSCALLIAELKTQRKKETEDVIRLSVIATARECWLGYYETTRLEITLCESGIAGEQPYSFDDFDASRKCLDEIRTEFFKSKENSKK